VDQDNLDDAMRRLAEERRRFESLRSDYSRIQNSRFHALRMLWFSLKAVLGFSVARDRYAAWSSGMGTSLPRAFEVVERNPLVPEDTHLASSWKSRMQQRPLDASDPIATIIIPVYNNADVTARCLQSIADTWFDTMSVQIVVVDDGSSDRTAEILTSLPGLEYLRLGRNQGFINACNRGAALARGKYVCFLNNDTAVQPAWLDHLVTLAESDPAIGAAGSKLIYPNGKLQEAGNIIWRDGNGWNYGRNEDPADSRYNYVRDVDYCSGAALLVRRSLFEQLGGFSETYAPAYYEDADLCFGIRALGFRVVYQPRSEVVHYEGVTSGTQLSSGIKRFQEVNRPKFREKWAKALEGHFENDPSAVPFAARRLRRGSSILIVDSYVPMYDKDAGSSRLMEIIRILCAIPFNVIFLPDNYAALQPYTSELQDIGVEVLHHVDRGRSMQDAIDSVLPIVSLAWICRPELFAKYGSVIRRNSATRILYDTIDLHFMRKRREIELLGGDESAWREVEQTELAAARQADATIVVTEVERQILRERSIDNVFVIPTVHNLEVEAERHFSASSGILFIGSYNHPPNVDAVRWLCKEIMPLVWRRNPDIVLTLLGSNPPDFLLSLESERIRVPGFVRDVRPYFLNARVFVAPLRYGAGMNGKVGHALSFRLPSVLTEIAAEGFRMTDQGNCLIANDAAGFANAIIRLYGDEALWTQFSRSAARVLEPFQSSAVAPDLVRMLAEVQQATPAGSPV